MGKSVALVVVAGFAAFGIASKVQASIPDSRGVIRGCYFKGSSQLERQGTLRVIDTDKGQTCRSEELPITWKQSGATGPSGRQAHAARRVPAGRRARASRPAQRVRPARRAARVRPARRDRPAPRTSSAAREGGPWGSATSSSA